MQNNCGIKHAIAHHEKNVVDQSREKVDAISEISVCYYHLVNNEESDLVNKMNEDVDVENKANDKVADLLIHDIFEENDGSTRIEQELQAEVGVSDNVELNQVHETNNADSHANTDSDDRINVGNQANDEQAESMFPDDLGMNDTSMPFE
jgi:hypothetical protein